MKLKEILMSTASHLPGITYRHYLGEADLPAFVEISNAANRADKIDQVSVLESIQQQYKNLRNCDPVKDMIVAEMDGNIVGYGRVWWAEESDPRHYTYLHFTTLHPDWRGKGINTAIYNWLENRAKEISSNHPADVDKFIDTWYPTKLIWLAEKLEKRGFKPERYFYEMTSDLSKPIPEAPMPEGLETRPVEEAHLRQIWEASNEAFRDHWGHSEGTEEDCQRMLSNIENLPDVDPNIWMVAWEGDEVAGMVLNFINPKTNAELNRKWGWTDPISVRRPWRKRGLARSLIVQSMKLLKEKGMEYAALGVDTQNPNNALKLYESCGYESLEEWVAVRKNLME